MKENLTLGMEASRFGFLVNSKIDEVAIKTLATIEPSIDPEARVSSLSVAQKQILEISRAASSGASVIIMDEPTAALSEREVERLFAVIRRLRDANVTVVYISHKLDEIFELGDDVTVFRDGKHIVTKPLAEVAGRQQLIELMIGRTVFQKYEPRELLDSDPILQVEHLNTSLLKDVSFHVNKGEVVGFYGLVGAGKTEIARAIYGADKFSGSVKFKGQEVGQTPHDTIAAGIALVPEERRTQGLFTNLTIRENVPVMNLEKKSQQRACFLRFVNGKPLSVLLNNSASLQAALKSTLKSFQAATNKRLFWQNAFLQRPICCCWMNPHAVLMWGRRQRSTMLSKRSRMRGSQSACFRPNSRRFWASVIVLSCCMTVCWSKSCAMAKISTSHIF